MTLTKNTLAAGAAIVALIAAGIGIKSVTERESAAVVASTAEDGMAEAERAELHAEIRNYLLSNPEIIVEVIDLLEAKRAAEAARNEQQMVLSNVEALFNDGYSYVGGNPDGDVTIVEFLDYQCGYCKRAHEEVKTLLSEDGNLRYIVKEFPILGPESVNASRAAMAVLENDGPEVYHDFNDRLMTFGGKLNEVVIAGLAEQAGADVDAMRQKMNDPEIETRITQNRQLAQVLQITGTPTFVIDDKLVRGYLPLAQMQEVVAQVRVAAN